jgi:RimJ/RimL family protein N-acetyltransferase
VGGAVVLETDRLVLRPMVPGDLDGLCRIFGDPLVMSAFEQPPLAREQVRTWLERNLDHQREHGYGLFAACLNSDGLLIGDCGLELMEIVGEEVAELGYDFRSDYWNQGYATEAACAVRDYAFETLGLRRLVSLIRSGNAASERVAEKTGLAKVEELERFGRPYLRYEIQYGRAMIAHDRTELEELARSYTEAWCSRDASRVAAHYGPGGKIAVNGGEPAGIADVAAGFIAAFPDIQVFMDDLVLREDGVVEYRWTFTGTSTETGRWVRIPGFEEWTIGADGLIAESQGHFDQDEYDRQLREGAEA